MREDPFDFKQAAFLYDWEDSGIHFLRNVDWNNKSISLWLDSKEQVLMDKLQLELVPYASSRFEINENNLDLLFPFVDTLLEEIFRPKKGRKYVIFGGNDFDDLFKLYNKDKNKCVFEELTGKNNIFNINGSQMNDTDKRAKGFVKKDGSVLSSTLYYKVIIINFKQKQQKALIAYTYPQKSFSKAFRIMQAYGKICYEEYNKYLNMP